MDHPLRPESAATSAQVRATSTRLARAVGVIGSVFAWLTCALATGAVAAFAAIVLGIRPAWVVLLLALPLTLVLGLCGCLRPRWGAPVAVASVLLAAFYAECLFANARVAAAVGFPFGRTFVTGGFGLTVLVARLGLDRVSLAIYALACVIAAVFGAWRASSSDHPRSPRSRPHL